MSVFPVGLSSHVHGAEYASLDSREPADELKAGWLLEIGWPLWFLVIALEIWRRDIVVRVVVKWTEALNRARPGSH